MKDNIKTKVVNNGKKEFLANIEKSARKWSQLEEKKDGPKSTK